MRLELLSAGVAALLLVLVSSVSVAEDEMGSHFAASVKHEAEGKYQEALDELLKVTDDRRDTYFFHLRKGWLLYSLGKYDKAIAAYGAAVEKEPGSVEAKLGLLPPQLAVRRWVDAEGTARAILELDPGNYLALSRLAYAYYNLTRFHEAEKYYRKVLATYPADLDMRSGYGWSLFKQGKYEEAKVQFKKIIRVSPKHTNALLGLQLCP